MDAFDSLAEPNPSAVNNGAEEPHTATVATVTREEEAETGQVPVVNTYNDDTGVVQVSAPTDDDSIDRVEDSDVTED